MRSGQQSRGLLQAMISFAVESLEVGSPNKQDFEGVAEAKIEIVFCNSINKLNQ